MTQWAVRGSLTRVWGGECDAVGGERVQDGFGETDVTQWAVAGGCDAVGCEKQFKEEFGKRM